MVVDQHHYDVCPNMGAEGEKDLDLERRLINKQSEQAQQMSYMNI